MSLLESEVTIPLLLISYFLNTYLRLNISVDKY